MFLLNWCKLTVFFCQLSVLLTKLYLKYFGDFFNALYQHRCLFETFRNVKILKNLKDCITVVDELK